LNGKVILEVEVMPETVDQLPYLKLLITVEGALRQDATASKQTLGSSGYAKILQGKTFYGEPILIAQAIGEWDWGILQDAEGLAEVVPSATKAIKLEARGTISQTGLSDPKIGDPDAWFPDGMYALLAQSCRYKEVPMTVWMQASSQIVALAIFEFEPSPTVTVEVLR